MSQPDLITIPGRWNFEYTYFAGESASRFFRELVDNRRIMGTQCPACKRVLVPARAFCDACMERTTDWVEVGPEGTLETFTIITTAFPGLPKPPIVMAYVTLDGADTALINLVHGEDLTDIERCRRSASIRYRALRVKFIDDPKGRITDFSFELSDRTARPATRCGRRPAKRRGKRDGGNRFWLFGQGRHRRDRRDRLHAGDGPVDPPDGARGQHGRHQRRRPEARRMWMR